MQKSWKLKKGHNPLQSNHVGLFDCDCSLWDKEIEKQTKIATHMDIWKHDQFFPFKSP